MAGRLYKISLSLGVERLQLVLNGMSWGVRQSIYGSLEAIHSLKKGGSLLPHVMLDVYEEKIPTVLQLVAEKLHHGRAQFGATLSRDIEAMIAESPLMSGLRSSICAARQSIKGPTQPVVSRLWLSAREAGRNLAPQARTLWQNGKAGAAAGYAGMVATAEAGAAFLGVSAGFLVAAPAAAVGGAGILYSLKKADEQLDAEAGSVARIVNPPSIWWWNQ